MQRGKYFPSGGVARVVRYRMGMWGGRRSIFFYERAGWAWICDQRERGYFWMVGRGEG
jgi:hypothetical protein